MIERVISGGQTGADQAGWEAARRCGIERGGWMPLGFKTLDGPRPEFAKLHNAKEHPSPDYPPRTYRNAEDADLTVWFGENDSRGFACTRKGCDLARKPMLSVARPDDPDKPPAWLAILLRDRGVRVLNVAGNRETDPPTIGPWVEEYLVATFRLLQDHGR